MRFEASQRQLIFIVICAIYLALAFAYAILVPPWESPDEPAHYLYAVQLAQRARPPLQPTVHQTDSFCRDYPYLASNYEWFQPALGYLPAAIIYKTLNWVAPRSLPRTIPPLNPQFCLNPSAHPNLFTHTNLRVFDIWKNAWGLLTIRIYLSLFGLAIIYAAYKIGCACDHTEGWLGIVAAGWVAFLPQFTFINASVRSDTLTNAIAALVLWLAVMMQTARAHTNKLALGMGLVLGLGLLGKHTFVYIVPVGLLAIVLTNPRAPRAWLKPATLMILPALVLVAAYYLTFDEARAALMHFLVSRAKLIALSPAYVSSIFPLLLFDSFYGRLCWMNVNIPATWTRIGFGVWSIGAALTLWQIIRRHKAIPFLSNIAILGVGILLAFAAVLYYNFSRYDPQGRFLFPILAAWAVFGFWGWWQILSARGKKTITLGALGFMLAFNLYALFFVLVPTYYK